MSCFAETKRTFGSLSAHHPARFAQRALRPPTRVPGLYLTGSDICSAGVGGAMMGGGVLAASVMIGRNLLGAVLGGAAAMAKRTSSADKLPTPL